MIHDRLVVGIKDGTLSQKLQLDPGLTLEKAKKQFRQKEAVGEQKAELKGVKDLATSLEGIHSSQERGRFNKRCQRPPTHKAAADARHCTRYGKSPHTHDKCPAKDVMCQRCQKKGHYSDQCFSKRVGEITADADADSFFLDTVSSNHTSSWTTEIQFDEHATIFKVDTGAEVTAISGKTYHLSHEEPI